MLFVSLKCQPSILESKIELPLTDKIAVNFGEEIQCKHARNVMKTDKNYYELNHARELAADCSERTHGFI